MIWAYPEARAVATASEVNPTDSRRPTVTAVISAPACLTAQHTKLNPAPANSDPTGNVGIQP